MKSKIFSTAMVLLCITVSVQAQTHQIRAVNKGDGLIGIELRITAGAPPAPGKFLTDLTFGLKWLSRYNVDLANTFTTGYNIIKSDVRKVKSGYHFQAFSATNTPFPFPAVWSLNGWVEIMAIRNTMTGAGTGTFEIAEPGFDATTDPNMGIDLVDYTPAVVASATNVLLPVRLKTFQITPENGGVKLQWTTANEQNNRGFEIERSEEKPNGFKSIGWAASKASSASDNQYVFVDGEIVAAVIYYYRLKQVDNNGRYAYSEVKSTKLDALNDRGIRILPNPVDKVLQVSFVNVSERGPMVLRVMDAKGAVLITRNHSVDAKEIVSSDVSSLISGQYFLVVQSSKGVIYTKAFYKN